MRQTLIESATATTSITGSAGWGGAKGTGHTFAHGGISAADAGKIGGAISKRGVTLTPEEKAKKKAEIIAGTRKNHKYYFNRMG